MNMDNRALNPQFASVYARYAIAQIPRLLSQLDRDQHSDTRGCFDRDHWSWKFRDFPLGMAQSAAYPLALLWRYPFPENPYYRSSQVLDWITRAVDFTLDRQHGNGAFDAFSPNEQDGGTTLGVLHGILESFRVVRDAVSEGLHARIAEATERACAFTRNYDEDHGFISNHRALFAVAFLDASELLNEKSYLLRAEGLIKSILERQSSDGWFLEYGGPDPGYESLGISHLAVYWQRTGSPELLASLRRAVEFYSWCVHPDGSAGGVYGSRQTALYFPGGFELLASEIPVAAAVSKFLRERLHRGNVVTPAIADLENLPPLLYSYLEASLAPGSTDSVPTLPCESYEGLADFEDSGISVKATRAFYFVSNASKGGICRAFDKKTGELVYEDAGYLVRTGKRRWISQMIGMGRRTTPEHGDSMASTTQFVEFRQTLLTPLRFLILRILNLTFFTIPRLGAWLRRQIVRRLVSAKRQGPFRLRRSVRFSETSIVFHDRLERSHAATVDEVDLPRSLLSIHMGSARYFHTSDLHDTFAVNTAGMSSALNQNGYAEHRWVLRFLPLNSVEPSNTHPEVVQS
jgi:hypothetical protein